jgi:mycoredoxin
MYGAAWCPDVLMDRVFLNRKGVDYDYRDIDRDEGAMDALLALRGKAWVVPTYVLPDGTILDNPSREELSKHLEF